MSATATPHSAPAHADDHGHEASASKFYIFIGIAMLLAVITGIEIILVYLPVAKWLVTTALVILSTVKFMFVIFFFMHLRWDKLFCTILFFIGLVLAGGTMAALLALFGSEDGKPLPVSLTTPDISETSQMV
jgi:cytochrome c oxidase subunit 4